MPFAFSSWESLSRPCELFKGAQMQANGYEVQLARFAKEQSEADRPIFVPCSWLFFRSQPSEDEAGFILTAPCSPPFVNDFLCVSFFNDDETTQLQHERFERSLQQGDFARVFFLDDQEELCQGDANARFALFMGAKGWAQWIRLNAGLEDLPLFRRHTAFRWSNSPDIHQFLMTPASQQWQIITQQKADAISDCAFARRTLERSKQEMSSLLLRWSRGSYAELEAVLRVALIEQSELWMDWAAYEWIIELDSLHKSWHRGKWTRLHSSVITDGTPPKMVHAILRRVAPYFEIAFDEALTTRYLEAARWAYRFDEKMSIRIENPTAHERLEAALFWRDWQATHPPLK